MSVPAPPTVSGKFMPIRPRSPISAAREVSHWWEWSILAAWGRRRRSANSRTVERMRPCSALSWRSTGRRAGARSKGRRRATPAGHGDVPLERLDLVLGEVAGQQQKALAVLELMIQDRRQGVLAPFSVD